MTPPAQGPLTATLFALEARYYVGPPTRSGEGLDMSRPRSYVVTVTRQGIHCECAPARAPTPCEHMLCVRAQLLADGIAQQVAGA